MRSDGDVPQISRALFSRSDWAPATTSFKSHGSTLTLCTIPDASCMLRAARPSDEVIKLFEPFFAINIVVAGGD